MDRPEDAVPISLKSDLAHDHRAVGTAEPEGIRQRDVDLHLPCLVGAVVEIALGILIEDVDGGRSDLVVDGQRREHGFDAAGGTSRCPVMDLVELTTICLA